MARMTKNEFQKLHGFNNNDMEMIDMALKMFKGKIVEITLANADKCSILLNRKDRINGRTKCIN